MYITDEEPNLRPCNFYDWNLSQINTIRWGNDKSLARPGRKKATVTKLAIYSTYSPRSLIHFLARCSNFCKPLKKIHRVVRPTRFPRQQWPPRRTKNGDFSIFFSVQGTGGSPKGSDPKNRGAMKTLEAQVGQFLLGCKCPVSRGIVVQEQDPLGDFPAAWRFSFKMSFNWTSRDD